MTLKLRQLTTETLTFSDGQSLRWADVEQVIWQGQTRHWLFHALGQRWQFKQPGGWFWLSMRLDAAIYALPHSQPFWGSTLMSHIPAEVQVWSGKSPQLVRQKERQMHMAQFIDWALALLMYEGLVLGFWFLTQQKRLGFLLMLALPVIVQILRYRLCNAFLKCTEPVNG